VKASVELDDYMKTFDFAIPVGLSYEYQNFVFDARYNFGVTKVFDNAKSDWLGLGVNMGDAKVHNSVFQFTIGYKFAL